MDNQATISIFEEIPLILTTTDKVTGLPVDATIQNIQWSQDNVIGEIIPDPISPNKAIFKPSKAGITHITATATIVI